MLTAQKYRMALHKLTVNIDRFLITGLNKRIETQLIQPIAEKHTSTRFTMPFFTCYLPYIDTTLTSWIAWFPVNSAFPPPSGPESPGRISAPRTAGPSGRIRSTPPQTVPFWWWPMTETESPRRCLRETAEIDAWWVPSYATTSGTVGVALTDIFIGQSISMSSGPPWLWSILELRGSQGNEVARAQNKPFPNEWPTGIPLSAVAWFYMTDMCDSRRGHLYRNYEANRRRRR